MTLQRDNLIFHLAWLNWHTPNKKPPNMELWNEEKHWAPEQAMCIHAGFDPYYLFNIPVDCLPLRNWYMKQRRQSPARWAELHPQNIPDPVPEAEVEKADDTKRRTWSFAQARAARNAGCRTRRDAELWLRREGIAEIRDGLVIPIDEDFKPVRLRTVHNNFYAVKNMHELT